MVKNSLKRLSELKPLIRLKNSQSLGTRRGKPERSVVHEEQDI